MNKYLQLTVWILILSPAYTWSQTCTPDDVYSVEDYNAVCMEVVENVRNVYSNNYPDHSDNYNQPQFTLAAGDYEYSMCGYPEQNTSFTPLYEEVETTVGCTSTYSFGVSINGVKYDPNSAVTFENTSTGEANLDWHVEATSTESNIGQNMGTDNGGHLNPFGEYHYHGVPTNYFTTDLGIDGSAHSPIVGYAADGFPIYYKYVYTDTEDDESGITSLSSGYALRSGSRPGDGVSAPDGVYDGLYYEDYEYTTAELDECNGRYGVTPDYPFGTYYYVITDTYPYIPRCFKGTYVDHTFRIGPDAACPASTASTSCSEVVEGCMDPFSTNYNANANVDDGSCAYETCTLTASISSTNISTIGADDGTATVTVAGGQGNISYIWSTGSTVNAVTGLEEGTYTVTVTDDIVADCSVDLEVTIGAQAFDYYGPKPFGDILNNSFNQPWTPAAISSIENRKYVVILDAATQSNAIMLNSSDISVLDFTDVDNVHGSGSTYGSLLRSVFHLVDINTHLDNDTDPLLGKYIINPMLHSYYGLNAATDNSLICTDAGTLYIGEEVASGYVLIEFGGTASSATIKASSQWEYSAGVMVEVSGWTPKWLKIDGNSVTWSTIEGEASNFYLADAEGLIDLTIEAGTDFNPLSETYQSNATAELPEINPIENSKLITDLEMKIDAGYLVQLGTSVNASEAASTMLDQIETTLTANSASLRYPKSFYLALRETMLSQTIASTDIYGAKLGYNTIPHVYFTNATDDNDIPHPFMVIASHAVSTRPNQLLDVSRPPGAEPGIGYGESTVTRHGKLAEFLLKIPLKDYGLVENLQDNDLTPYGGDLATDFDNKMATITTKDVYNYAGLASAGVAIDGVTIYPAFNNNLRFAVEDGEVTHSGIHVGGGLELHYHADGHAFNGNGINLYNIADYEGNDHPPVIGIAHDGVALFGKYEANYPSMAGFGVNLDEYGGHDHGDGFGYHYHAHTQNVESSGSPGTFFNEHFLLVGAWKGNINDIPGFNEGKLNQFEDESIARYAGASYESVEPTPGTADVEACDSYEWEGTTYTASGSYTIDLTSSSGGDSTATLNLTIIQSVESIVNETVCDNYQFDGQMLTTSGTYNATFPASNSCDSLVTLHLTILDPESEECDQVLGVMDEGVQKNLFNVYPNPTSEQFKVDLGKKFLHVKLEIFSITGKSIKTQIFDNTSLISIQDDLLSGSYIIRITGDEVTETHRFTKN